MLGWPYGLDHFPDDLPGLELSTNLSVTGFRSILFYIYYILMYVIVTDINAYMYVFIDVYF